MAKKTYTGDVAYTSNVDWGGDSSTQNLPLSGEAVQKWIKENLNHKAGYFKTLGNYCYAFSNAEAYSKWVETGSDNDSELIIGKFAAPSDYSATLNIIQDKKSSAYGSTGNTIDFTWGIFYKTNPIQEAVNCTIVFKNGVNSKTVTFPILASQTTFSYNVDAYLLAGLNNITISIIGQINPVTAGGSIQYDYVNFGMSDTYDISQVYDITDPVKKNVMVPFTLTGQGQYGLEWWWDGIKLKPSKIDEGRMQQGSFSGTKEIDLTNMAPDGVVVSVLSGVHSLQFRGFVESNGSKFYSDTFYREIIINNNNELTNTVFAIKENIPKDIFDNPKDNVPDKIKLYGLEQFIPYDFSISTYYPGSLEYIETVVSLERMKTKYPINLKKGHTYDLQITPDVSGNTKLLIKSGDTIREINTVINKNSLGLEEDSTLLEFYFKSDGRTNSSSNKDKWSYTDYNEVTHTAKFNNFMWTDTSGWYNNKLVFDSTSEIVFENYNPFVGAKNGKTIEIEFSTNKVLDNNAIICDLISEDGTGLLITATEATLKTQGYSVSTKFKPEENVRISVVFEKVSSEKPLILLYLDGILSGACTWEGKMGTDKTMSFKGSDNVSFTIKQIRVQNKDIDSNQIVNNFILYQDTSADMQYVYNRNNIYENGNISVNKLAEVIPVMIVTGDIPSVDEQTAENKSKVTIMQKIQYIDYIYNKSFVFERAGISCQGTSSMTYPKKNYRIYAEEKKLSKPIASFDGKGWTYDPDHTGFFTMDINDIDNRSAWKEAKWKGKKEGKHKFYYSFKDEGEYENGTPPGVTRWTIKADFAESSGTHNTGVARIWNKAMYAAKKDNDFPLRTTSQKYAKMIGYEYDVRTTVDGIPIVMFYQLNEQDSLHFMGKYNFNNDKTNETLFGFTGIGDGDFEIDEQSGEAIAGSPLSEAERKLFEITPEPFYKEHAKDYGYNLDESGRYIVWHYYEKQDDGTYKIKQKSSKKYKDRIQCWELTNSGSRAALFAKVDYDELRATPIAELGYEARFPDDAEDLKADYKNNFEEYAKCSEEYNRWWAFVYPFYAWMSHIREKCKITYDEAGLVKTWEWDNETKNEFSRDKKYFMDVDKMAAYYVYLIRFGAVDQVLKNAMLTTDDGFHWYYINYDNDTILGLNNLGNLAFGPDITRYTRLAGANDFDYAGRNSTLWNCLELDDDFMATVSKIDDALKTNLSYSDMIKVFDTDSSNKWCETVYNKDAEYKYVQSYKSGKPGFLGSMQGSRKMHRHWWISERFDYYDGEYNSSIWQSTGCVFNIPSVPVSTEMIKITAGKTGWYGIYADGSNRDDWRRKLNVNSSTTFTSEKELTQIGRNYILLGSHNVYEIDLSLSALYLTKIELSGVNNTYLGSKLRRLILSSDTSPENKILIPSEVKALNAAVNLEYFDMRKYKALTAVNGLNTLKNLKVFRAGGSGLTTVSFANGAPLETVELPSSVTVLNLYGLPVLTLSGIVFDNNDYSSVTDLTINNCRELTKSWQWLKRFTSLKRINLNVEWSNIEWNDLMLFLDNKEGSLSGIISVINPPSNILEILSTEKCLYWFGEDCLDPKNTIYLKLPAGIYAKLSKNQIIEGVDTDEGKTQISYTFIECDPTSDVVTHFSQDYSAYVKIKNKEITALEKFDQNTVVPVTSYLRSDPTISNKIYLTILDKIYPNVNNSDIIGESTVVLNEDQNYVLTPKENAKIQGEPNSYTWSVEGSEEALSFIELTQLEDKKSCKIHLLDINNNGLRLESLYNVTIKLIVNNKKSDTTEDITFKKEITICEKKDIIFSKWSNPGLWDAILNGFVPGWDKLIAEEGRTSFVKSEAEIVERIDPSKSNGIINFEEFKFFTGIINPSFEGCKTLKTITLPSNISNSTTENGNKIYGIPDRMFYDCTALERVELDTGFKGGQFIVGNSAFGCKYSSTSLNESITESDLSHLNYIGFSKYITTVGIESFKNCVALKSIELPNCVDIGSGAFYTCLKLSKIEITDLVTSIGSSAFWSCSSLTSFKIPNQLTFIPTSMLSYCRNITNITIPDSVTKIEDEAFSNIGITNIDLNNVEYIGRRAFASSQLQEINLSRKVTFIGEAAFANTRIQYFTGESPYVLNGRAPYLVNNPEYDELTGKTHYTLYAVGSIQEFEFDFPENVDIKSINESAFYLNNAVTYVKIPASITTLPRSLFYGCSSLRKVILPEGITEITSSMFGWCRNLVNINGDSGINDLQYITRVSSEAFQRCESLQNVYFKKLEYIGESAFENCSKLGDFTVNNETPPQLANPAKTFGQVETYSSSSVDSRMGVKVNVDSRFVRVPSQAMDNYKNEAGWAKLASQDFLYTYVAL